MNSPLILSASVLTAIGFGAGLAAAHIHNGGANRAEHTAQVDGSPAPLAHARSEFSFIVHAPLQAAARLFGAEAERGWGGSDWDPRFLYPQPVRDVEGAVFLVQHGGHTSTWVTTALDFPAGHVQYVNIIDGAMATKIDIHLAPAGPENTSVSVVYERTALQQEANDHVTAFAKSDSAAGPHWETAINNFLKTAVQPK